MNALKHFVSLAVLMLTVLGPATSHGFLEHTCTAPAVPERFETIWELDAFTEKAAVFRKCIEDYVEAVKETASKQDTLIDDSIYYQQKAIDDFNAFSDLAYQRIEASNIPFIDAIA